MAENKTLKFDFSIDNQSFMQVKQKIDQLTAALKELANVAKSININTGGIAAGGNMGSMLGGISTGRPQAGLPNMNQSAATGRPTNVAGVLTQGLVADKQMFQTVAQGSKEALRAMKDALKQTVDDQSRDIKRLKKEIDDLAKSYNQLNKNELTRPLARTDFAEMAAKGKELDTLVKAHAKNESLLNPSFLSRLGFNPRGAMVGGGIAAGVTLAAMAANYGAEQYYGSGAANIQEKLYSPFAQQHIAAGVGGTMSGMAMQMRQGNLAMINSTARVLNNSSMMESLFGNNKDARQLLALYKAGEKNTISDWARQGQEILGTELYNRIQGEHGEINTDIVKRHLLNQIPVDRAKEFNEAVQRDMQIDQERTARFNNFYANSQNSIDIQRMLGTSSIDKNGNWHDATARADKRAGKLGLGLGQMASAIHQAKFSVGAGNSGHGVNFLMKSFGGFGNAAEVFAAGDQYGSGAGLLKALAGSGGIAGRGGIDALAASMLGGTVSQQIMGSRYGAGDGIGLTEALGGVAGMAGTVGGQIRLARQLGLGLGNLSEGLQGKTDGLQQAINAYAGAKTFGGNFYQMNAMNQLSGGDLVGILRSGKVGDRLGDLGIGIDQVRQYAAERDRFALGRYHAGQGSQTMDSVVAAAQSAGGPMAYIKNQLAGLKGKEKRNRFLDLTRILGGAEAASTGGSAEEYIGGLRAQLGGDKDLISAIRGSGVGDSTSKKDPAREARAKQGEVAESEAKKLEAEEKALRETISQVSQMPDKLRDVGAALMAGEQTLRNSLVDLAKFIDEKITHIKRPDGWYENTSALKPPSAAPPPRKAVITGQLPPIKTTK